MAPVAAKLVQSQPKHHKGQRTSYYLQKAGLDAPFGGTVDHKRGTEAEHDCNEV